MPATSATATSWSPRSATSATFRTAPRTFRPPSKKEPWARLGVNVEDEFQPLYVVDPDKKKKVDELKRELKSSTELILATDEDREGEAIAWHLLEVLKPKVPVKRMVFHEITREAIERALGETREIDDRLVDAQETRTDPRPALRLRGVARALEEGDATPLGRARPVGRDAPRGRARARADAVRRCHLLGHRRDVRARRVRGEARRGRRPAGGAGTRLRRGRPAQVGHPGARRGGGARARSCARRRLVRGALGRGEAVPAQPGGPVHDLDAATGGEPQAPVLVADDDARRPAAVRERIHHLHAHRLDDAVGVGADGRPQAGGEAVRAGVRPRGTAPATGAR